MSADPVITLKTRFRRNMRLADFEMAEAEIGVEQTFPGDMAPEDVQAHVAGMFVYAKSGVFDQLGLGYEQDEATGLVMETFPGTKVVGSSPSKAAREPDQAPGARKAATDAKSVPEPYTDPDEAVEDEEIGNGVQARPVRSPRQSAKASSGRPSAKAQAMTVDEMWEHMEQNPGEWFDNRESKQNPKAPDYRAKNIPNPKNPQMKAGLWEPAPDWFQNPFD